MKEYDKDDCQVFEKHGFVGYIGITNKAGKITIYVLIVLIIFAAFVLIALARHKLKKVKARDLRKAVVDHDTYCITGVYILRWLLVQLALIVMLAVSTLAVMIISDTTHLEWHLFSKLILFIFRPLINISMMCYLQVYLFMTAE